MPSMLGMARFILIYKGTATDTADMTEEQGAAVMAKWATWMGAVGSALVDVGAPFGGGVSLVDDGSIATPVPTSGYSIIEAANLETAKRLANGHPYLSDATGAYAIDIFELMPVPFEA